MQKSAVFALLSFLFVFLSVPVASLPLNGTVDDTTLDRRATYNGRGTWFNPSMGACGEMNSNSDPIIALPVQKYGASSSIHCGQWIAVTNTANGKTAYGMVRDKCPGCGEQDLDMSPGLFQQIGSLGTGVLHISWHFMPKDWHH